MCFSWPRSFLSGTACRYASALGFFDCFFLLLVLPSLHVTEIQGAWVSREHTARPLLLLLLL